MRSFISPPKIIQFNSNRSQSKWFSRTYTCAHYSIPLLYPTSLIKVYGVALYIYTLRHLFTSLKSATLDNSRNDHHAKFRITQPSRHRGDPRIPEDSEENLRFCAKFVHSLSLSLFFEDTRVLAQIERVDLTIAPLAAVQCPTSISRYVSSNIYGSDVARTCCWYTRRVYAVDDGLRWWR